jgi:hypothetical protein
MVGSWRRLESDRERNRGTTKHTNDTKEACAGQNRLTADYADGADNTIRHLGGVDNTLRALGVIRGSRVEEEHGIGSDHRAFTAA